MSALRSQIALLAFALTLGNCGVTETVATVDAPIVVPGPAGRVVINRQPFALRVEDATGRTVLALAPSTRVLGDTTYAPLAVSSGDVQELAFPVLPGSIDTNPMTAVPASQFSGQRVVSARLEDGAATIEVATDAPDGRLIELRVAPRGDASFTVDVTSTGATAVSASFASGADEAFHGFGGRRESTNLRGIQIRNWVFDYRFPDVSTAYYYAEPLFFSSRGYGLLLDQTQNAVFRMASDVEDAWRVDVLGPHMRLVVTPSDAAQAIEVLTEITGRHRKPPAWALGPTLSRAVEPLKTMAQYQAHVVDDLSHVVTGELPVSAYCFEGWATLPDAFVSSTVTSLRAAGVHPCMYVRSFVSKDIAGTQAPADFDEALANGYVATHPDGTPYLAPSPFANLPMAVVDFTNLQARQWWKGKVRAMLDSGADGFMDDFGEQVLSDMVFTDGSTGAQIHNLYPVLQHAAAREAVDEYERDHPDREIYFFGRAGYTGSAAYESATFPGDELADFSRGAGLPSIIPDMLNRAVGGAFGFTTDIAGYADFHGSATKELYARWSEAAALMPFFRVHNGPLNGTLMPWSFDAETQTMWQSMAELHTSVEGDLLTAWDEAVSTGMPVVRPLWLADPASAMTPHNDDEWLLGPDILAAPVVVEGATSREVWIPSGCWQSKGTGAPLAGPTLTVVDAPVDDLPWFKRCAP